MWERREGLDQEEKKPSVIKFKNYSVNLRLQRKMETNKGWEMSSSLSRVNMEVSVKPCSHLCTRRPF